MNGESAQQDGIHQAENCRICADAERQGENRDRGERWVLGQQAKAKFEVLPECAHVRIPAFLTEWEQERFQYDGSESGAVSF